MNAVQSLAWPRPDRSMAPADRLARGLGWFSLALGVTELVAPGRLARALGLQGKERLVQAYGAREIGSGMGALSINPAPAIWSRVAGDAVDLATLAVGAQRARPEQRRSVWIATALVAGVTALDFVTAAALSSAKRKPEDGLRDYSDRSGFPKGVQQARRARSGYVPSDMRAAPALAEPELVETPSPAGTTPIRAA